MIASSSPERKPIEITFSKPAPTARSKGIILPAWTWTAPSIASSPRSGPDIGVEQPHDQTPPGKRDGKVHAHRDLPTPPFPTPRRALSPSPGCRLHCALLGFQPRSRHERDRSAGSMTPVRTVTPSTPGTALTWRSHRTELISQRARSDCEGDLHGHSPTGLDPRCHAPFRARRCWLRARGRPARKRRLDGLGGGACRRRSLRMVDRGGIDTRLAHGMIEPNGAVGGPSRLSAPNVLAKGDPR